MAVNFVESQQTIVQNVPQRGFTQRCVQQAVKRVVHKLHLDVQVILLDPRGVVTDDMCRVIKCGKRKDLAAGVEGTSQRGNTGFS